jgi:hypothetical protein
LANVFEIFDVLGLVDALAVIIPGLVLLLLIKGVKVPTLRNLTLILSGFAILHGFYHISYLVGWDSVAVYIDLATAFILVYLGIYYTNKVIAVSLFLVTLPIASTLLVPLVLAIALILFLVLAIQAKTIKSLQAQLSIFLVIWAVAELLRSLLTIGIISATLQNELIGLEVHTVAMLAFGFFMIFRFYRVTSKANEIPKDWFVGIGLSGDHKETLTTK